MRLDEANAQLCALLAEERDPTRRARLVAAQLALGFPHALEVEPDQLAELRAHETAKHLARWRAQTWLGAASIFAAAWNAFGVTLWSVYAYADSTLSVMLAGFFIGLVHAIIGLTQAHRTETVAWGTLRALAWMGLLGPGLSLSAGLGFDDTAFLCGLFCATPSMLVSLAAYLLSVHTPRR